MRFLAVFFLVTCAQLTSATMLYVPSVELPGAATETRDGFRIHIDTTAADGKPTQDAPSVPVVIFHIEVPREVGRTYLGVVFLEIERPDKSILLQTTLDRVRSGSRDRCYVFVERSLAADCVLHFQYKAHRTDINFVKDYVVRLKHHIPKQP